MEWNGTSEPSPVALQVITFNVNFNYKICIRHIHAAFPFTHYVDDDDNNVPPDNKYTQLQMEL